MLRQFLAVKDEHPEFLLLYQVGDFYEILYDDAATAAAALGITLTERSGVPLCGFPVGSLETYLGRLVRGGHLVAVCEQTESPAEAKARGSSLVRREVTRLVTPGTLVGADFLSPRESNFLAAVAHHPPGTAVRTKAGATELGLAYLDVSTGEFATLLTSPATLEQELARVRPAELLVSDDLLRLFPALEPALRAGDYRVTPRPAPAAASRRARELAAPRGGADEATPLEAAAGAVALDYVLHTQRGRLPRLAPVQRGAAAATVAMDPAARRSLELTRSLARGDRRDSLLAVADRTSTAGGSRLLALRLGAPLTDAAEVSLRLDAVEWFARDAPEALQPLRRLLGRSEDLERAVQRLSLRRGGPRDLAAVATTLDVAALALRELGGLPPGVPAALLDAAADGPLAAVRDEIARALVAEPPASADAGGFVAAGYLEELDTLRGYRDEARRLVAELQERYREETGVGSLRVRHNNVIGYFVEVPRAQAARLDGDGDGDGDARFERAQALKNTARFKTAELTALQDRAAEATAEALRRELEVYEELVALVLGRAPDLLRAAHALAALDVAAGSATLALERGYSRPKVLPMAAAGERPGPSLLVEDGRHPTVEATTDADFTANSCRLGGEGDGRVWVVGGPNMSGKSTFLRSVALVVVLAQAGLFVPARRARFHAVDRLYSRVGSTDDISRNQSSFLAEMSEMSAILASATENSLVIADEVGRGTAAADGLAISAAVVEHLHGVSRCRTLFATHYHELHLLGGLLPGVSCHHMAVGTGEGLVYAHRVLEGPSDGDSRGVFVARLAGMPEAVTSRAEAVLGGLRGEHAAYKQTVAGVFRRELLGGGEAPEAPEAPQK